MDVDSQTPFALRHHAQPSQVKQQQSTDVAADVRVNLNDRFDDCQTQHHYQQVKHINQADEAGASSSSASATSAKITSPRTSSSSSSTTVSATGPKIVKVIRPMKPAVPNSPVKEPADVDANTDIWTDAASAIRRSSYTKTSPAFGTRHNDEATVAAPPNGDEWETHKKRVNYEKRGSFEPTFDHQQLKQTNILDMSPKLVEKIVSVVKEEPVYAATSEENTNNNSNSNTDDFVFITSTTSIGSNRGNETATSQPSGGGGEQMQPFVIKEEENLLGLTSTDGAWNNCVLSCSASGNANESASCAVPMTPVTADQANQSVVFDSIFSNDAGEFRSHFSPIFDSSLHLLLLLLLVRRFPVIFGLAREESGRPVR